MMQAIWVTGNDYVYKDVHWEIADWNIDKNNF